MELILNYKKVDDMVDFTPSDFYLQHPTSTASPEFFKKVEESQRKGEVLAELFKSGGKQTVEIVGVTPEGKTITKQQLLSQELVKQTESELKNVASGVALGAPIVISFFAPEVGIPMLIGELSSIGATGAADVLEDVFAGRPIRIDYPMETYIASGIGGEAAGLVGAYISPFAASGLAKFGAGGLIGTTGLFVKDITEEPLMGKPIKLESPLTYASTFLISGGLYWGLSKATDWLTKQSEQGKITWIKPGMVEENGETWIGIYKERGTEAQPIFGLRIRNLGEGKYDLAFGKELTFTSYSPITETGEINLPKSPIETYLKLPAMKEFYQKMAEGGLTPEQLDIAREFFNKIYTQPTPYPVSSLKEVIDDMERAEGFKEDLYEVLSKFLKENDIMIYGSASQKMYGALGREVHDLDIQALKPRVAESLVNKLQEELEDDIIVKAKPDGTGYEVLNKAGEKVMEIFKHGIGYSPYSRYLGYGYYPKTPIKTDEGLFMRLEEQGARKLISSFTPQETQLFPLEHRIKDVGDLISVMNYYANKNPDLKPLFEKFLKSGNEEVMQKILSQIPEKLTFTFSFSSSVPQSSLPLYTSIFAGSSASSIASYAIPSIPVGESKPSKSGKSESSKGYEQTSQPSAPSKSSSYPYIPYSPSFPSYPSFSSPSSPSYPSYPSPPSYPSLSPSSSPSSSPPSPPSQLPSLPLLFPRNIDLNKKIDKLMYKSMWRSELKYV
jgi:hypothetical protein